MILYSYLSILFLLLKGGYSIGDDDLVTNLPGLTFETNFKFYSGYLNSNVNGTWKMHYWLTESQSDPANDPLILWFNGGPGCSSFAGSFEELGPFYVNKDGQTLYQNVYAWNMHANVLFLESPIGVGFSYDTQTVNGTVHNDDLTATQNYNALVDFFQRVQPKYANRTFYITGESYAGHYIPQLTKLIVQGLIDETFPNTKFMGVAIGNGEFSSQRQQNSIVLWSFYHGRISLDDWQTIKAECKGADKSVTDIDQYDFFYYMKSTNGMDYFSDGSKCGDLLAPWVTVPDNMDPYNFYQDCWAGTSAVDGQEKQMGRSHMKSHLQPPVSKAKTRRVKRNALSPNTANTINMDSTDFQWGYPCWNDDALTKWANRKDVQKALHIDSAWQNMKTSGGDDYPWMDCNDNAIYNLYVNNYLDTTPFFDFIIQNVGKAGLTDFKFLIYNGDIDTVCNYLGDAWHLQNIAKNNGLMSSKRHAWNYRNQTAGFVQNYAKTGLSIDVLTVKGSGHFVPNDRPGASLQMITNFLFPPKSPAVIDYSNPISQPNISPMITTTTAKTDKTGSTSVRCLWITLLVVMAYIF